MEIASVYFCAQNNLKHEKEINEKNKEREPCSLTFQTTRMSPKERTGTSTAASLSHFFALNRLVDGRKLIFNVHVAQSAMHSDQTAADPKQPENCTARRRKQKQPNRKA